MHTLSIHGPSGRTPAAEAPPRLPVRLRRVDGALAELRAFVGAGRRATLTAGDAQRWTLEVCHAGPAAASLGRRSVCMDTPHGRIAMGPSRDFLRVLTRIDLADDGDDVDPLDRLALDLAVRALPQDWFTLFQASSLLAGFEGPAGPAELTLKLLPADSRLAVATHLHGSAEALLAALSDDRWRRIEPARSPLPDDLSLNVPLCVGHVSLASADMLALQAGDVVILTQPMFDLQGLGVVRLGGRRANCVWHLGNQSSLEFTEWDTTTANPNMDTEPEPMPADNEDEIDAHLDDLPVALTFEAGMVELSLRDLKALAPGCVLHVAGLPPASVRIRSGGRLIGSGELVEIDGRMGVEITRLGHLD